MNNIASKRHLIFFEVTFSFFVLFFITICLLFSCKEHKAHLSAIVTPAVYHWETHLQLSDREIQFLDQYNITSLYVRFFDVDRRGGDGEPIPIATTSIDTVGLSYRQIIPVVFITNRTLKNLTTAATDSLANRIVKKIQQQWKEHFQQEIHEIQLDCDWSESTRPAYFRLLERVNNQLPNSIILSATIRLHQVKYFQRTGVPPVDRGMLMYYNMGEVDKWETKNAILDTSIAAQYLYNFDRYPLSLDVALPIFSWGAVFRDGKLVQLVHHLGKSYLQDSTRFESIGINRYRVKKDTYIDGFYCYAGDLIRREEIEEALLVTARKQLQRHLPVEDRRVVFYHLHDKINIDKNLWEDW